MMDAPHLGPSHYRPGPDAPAGSGDRSHGGPHEPQLFDLVGCPELRKYLYGGPLRGELSSRWTSRSVLARAN